MKKYSVVIPTANRPHYLETALKSVKRQTVANEIEEVLVSENLGCRESEAVCAKFPHLPIRYIFREPQLGNTEHIQSLFMEAEAPFVALLCDDDWWTPSHLQTAGSALEADESVSSWFAAILFSASEEEREATWIYRPAAFWFGAGLPDVTQQWRLNFEKIAVITWLLTPFQFSTMVARREALREAAKFMEGAHPYYADRILYPGLALQGDILYEPLVDTYARWHAGNWMKDKKYEELTTAFREGSEKIRCIGEKHGQNPVSAWQALVANVPKALRKEIASSFQSALSSEQLKQLGFPQFIPKPPPSKIIRISKKLIRGFRLLPKALSR